MPKPQPKNTAELLHSLFEVTASETGEDLFRALTRNHKGHISVESDVGKGTELTIQLPVR